MTLGVTKASRLASSGRARHHDARGAGGLERLGGPRRQAIMHGLERRPDDVAAAIEVALDAAPGKMQHAVDAALLQRRPHRGRKCFGLGGAVDHHGADRRDPARPVRRSGPRRRDRAAAPRAGKALAPRAAPDRRRRRRPTITSAKPAARAASALLRPTASTGSASSSPRRGWSRQRARAVGAGDQDRRPTAARRDRHSARLRSAAAAPARPRARRARSAAAVRSLSGSGRVTRSRMISTLKKSGPARPFSSRAGIGAELFGVAARRPRASSRRLRCRRASRSCRGSASVRRQPSHGRRSACGRSRRARRETRARQASALNVSA